MRNKLKNLFKFDILDGGGAGGNGGTDTGGADTSGVDTGGTDTGNTSETSFINSDGQFSDGWQSRLSEDLREDNTLKAITDINQMSKMLVSSQKMIGQNRIALPDQNSDENAWNEFYTKIGRPESSDKYEINTENVPAEVKDLIEGDMAWYKEVSHKNGLTNKQSQDLFNAYQEHNTQQLSELQGQQAVAEQEKITELRNEWGVEYDKNVNIANQALNVLGMKDDIVNSGLANNTTVIKLLNAIGTQIGDDKLISADTNQSAGIQSEINSIMGDKDNAYWNKNNPRHNEMVQRVQMLYTKMG